MEVSSPKRRRVSPAEEPNMASHAGGHQADPSVKQPRPSFASPTKASMERYNPEILRSRGSSPKRHQVPEMALAPTRGGSLPTQRKLFTASKPSLDVEDSLLQNDNEKGKAANLGANANPSGRLMSGALPSSPGANVAASDMAADANLFRDKVVESTPTKKTAFIPAPKPSPRPLPPPGPEEDFLEPLTRNRHRFRSGLFPELVVPEPELPPTPEHPDPVVSTPPSGIHNTPSRRFKRKRSVLEKSSPLKKQSTLAEYGVGHAAVSVPLPTSTTAALRGIKRALPKSEEEEHLKSLKARNRELRTQLTKLAVYNQQARDNKLSTDETSVPANVLDILSLAVPGVKEEPQGTSLAWDSAAWDITSLLPFSKASSAIPTIFPQQDAEPEKPPVSHRPLPFTADTRGFMRSLSNLTLKTRTEALPKATGEEVLFQKQYIQAESAHPPGILVFSVAVTVNTQSQRVEEIKVPQIHPAAAAETQEFIHALTKPRKDASRAARYNIGIMGITMGEWLRVASARANMWCVLKEELATKEGLEKLVERIREKKNPTEEDSIEDASGGIQQEEDGHWPEAAEIEAEWPEDEGINVDSPEHLGHPLEGKTDKDTGEADADLEIPEDDALVSNGPARPTGGKSDDNEAWEDEEALYIDRLEARGNGTSKSGGHLPYLGQTSMDFSVPRLDGENDDASQAQLRVQWKISFKPTGYAVSDIKVLIGAPAKWHAADDRGRLSGIPGMFAKLIAAGEEPVDAVRIVAALLAGELKS